MFCVLAKDKPTDEAPVLKNHFFSLLTFPAGDDETPEIKMPSAFPKLLPIFAKLSMKDEASTSSTVMYEPISDDDD
jgi:hypothetical protein